MSLSTALLDRMLSMIDTPDIEAILAHQSHSLASLKDRSSRLVSLYEFSTLRYAVLSQKFEHHVKVIRQLRLELEGVFKRIRTLKAKVTQKYPEANQRALALLPPRRDLDAEEEEEEEKEGKVEG